MKPWEKYQEQPATKPWEKYGAQDPIDASKATGELSSVFDAPELNEFSMPAAKSGLGGLLTGDKKDLTNIIKGQFPDAEFTEYGSIKLPSGEYNIESSAPARFVADVGTFMAGGPIGGSIGKRVAKEIGRASLVESGQELTEQGLGGSDFSPKKVALAGATELGGQAVGEVLSGLARGIFGKASKESTDLIKAGEQANIPVMTSDILPPRTFMGKSWQTFMERLPVLGTGGGREAQEALRKGALEKMAADFGVTADIPYSETVIKSLDKMKVQQLSKAAKLKSSSQLALSSLGEVPRDNFIKAIDNAIASEAKFGSKADNALIDSLEQWKQTPTGDFSFMDGLRSRLGDEISDYYKGSNSQIGSKGVGYLQGLKSALTKDMDSMAAKVTSPAMKSAANDWKRANAMFFQEYGNYQKTALKGLLDKGEIMPEVVMNVLRGNKPSQSKLLYENLTPSGRSSAKGAIIQDLLSKADGSPEKFLSAAKKMDPNIKVFFKGDDMKVLQGFTDVLNSTRQAAKAGLSTQTGQQLYPILTASAAGYGASVNPLATAAVLGAAASGRMYESKAVRNGLLRLVNTPKGSTRYDTILKEVTDLMTDLAQAPESIKELQEAK